MEVYLATCCFGAEKVILLLNVAWIIMKVAISSRRVIGRYLHV